MKGRQLIIMVKNTHGNAADKRSGVFYSTKHEGEGVGLPSVRKVAEKYQGIMKAEYDKSHFTAYVILNTTDGRSGPDTAAAVN